MRLDYFEIVDPETLDPVEDVSGGALVAVAAFVGSTRLIDNVLLVAETGDHESEVRSRYPKKLDGAGEQQVPHRACGPVRNDRNELYSKLKNKLCSSSGTKICLN